MSNDKMFDMLIRYKNQVTIAIAFIMGVVCFVGGRISVHIPPKEVVCKAEIATKDKLFEQIEKERKQHLTDIRACHDEEQAECKTRVAEAIEKYKITQPAIDCDVCRAIVPQCVKRKKPICK